MKLGEVLLGKRLLTTAKVEQALQAQALLGGRLGTNLVELGILDLETLTSALSMQSGVPAAQQEQFERIRPAALALLPASFAGKHSALPLGLLRGSDKLLVVALRDPHDFAAIEELQYATGKRITATVAPELRIFFYLEKCYRIPRKPRYLRSSGSAIPARPAPGSAVEAFAPGPAANRRQYATPNPPPAGQHAAVARQDDPMAAFSLPVLEEAAALFRPSAASTAELASPPVQTSLAQALARIERAEGREDIASAMIDGLRAWFACTLVLIAKGEMVLGWRGYAPA
jgi:hypothetical protein